MRIAHLARFIVLFATPALAGANLEYGEAYETAYLDQCTREHSERACQCSMEALQDRVGFLAFAEEVDTHGRRFMEGSEFRFLAADLLGRCTAVGKAQ
jgi:hypothetical protein